MMLLSKSVIHNVALLISRIALMPCPLVKRVTSPIFMQLYQVAVATSSTRSLEVKVRIAGGYGGEIRAH